MVYTRGDDEQCDSLVCSDFVFVTVSESLNRTEPIVYNFTRESEALIVDIEGRKSTERMEVI